jgi:hypothetical protein
VQTAAECAQQRWRAKITSEKQNEAVYAVFDNTRDSTMDE